MALALLLRSKIKKKAKFLCLTLLRVRPLPRGNDVNVLSKRKRKVGSLWLYTPCEKKAELFFKKLRQMFYLRFMLCINQVFTEHFFMFFASTTKDLSNKIVYKNKRSLFRLRAYFTLCVKCAPPQ